MLLEARSLEHCVFSAEWMVKNVNLPAQISNGAQQQLTGYLNDKWIIFNVHQFYSLNLLEKFPPGDGVHLDDEKQRIIEEELAHRVRPWICGDHAKLGRRQNRSVLP